MWHHVDAKKKKVSDFRSLDTGYSVSTDCLCPVFVYYQIPWDQLNAKHSNILNADVQLFSQFYSFFSDARRYMRVLSVVRNKVAVTESPFCLSLAKKP